MITDELSAREWIKTLPNFNAATENRLAQLVELLTEENARQNLVSVSSLSHVWQRHIADSAQMLLHVPRETSGEWLDLGTGAGFPGLVIAILRPGMAVSMVESRPKRIAWLNRIVATLNLPNARVIGSRLELVEVRHMAVISARAFAPLDRLIKLSARFSDPDTIWLLPKGRSAAHELAELKNWQHMFHVEQSLTDQAAGLIVGRLNDKVEQGR